jgi:hypothetical protein
MQPSQNSQPPKNTQPPWNAQPYTQPLNLLRKIDLLRLCLEFKLPSDGSVPVLRARLRTYLNARRESLAEEPRFAALYPGKKPPPRPTQPRNPPPPVTRSKASRTFSRDLSYRSSSPSSSEESWGGIQDVPQQQLPPPLPYFPHQPPVHPLPEDIPQHQGGHLFYPPPFSEPGSAPGSPLLAPQPVVDRKYSFLYATLCALQLSPLPFSVHMHLCLYFYHAFTRPTSSSRTYVPFILSSIIFLYNAVGLLPL